MKKKTKMFNIISLLLAITFLLCTTVTPLLADETSNTEEEILLAAREGMLVYDIIGGWASFLSPGFDREYWGYDEYSYLIDGIIGDYNYIQGEYPIGEPSDYYKTGNLIKDYDSLINLVDTYFYNYTYVFKTEDDMTNKNDVPEYPILITISGESYIASSWARDYNQGFSAIIFEEFEVTEINKSLAKVKVVVNHSVGNNRLTKNDTITEIDMVKTKSGWKICGGKFFDPYVNVVLENWFENATPVTSDASTRYLIIAASALATMSVVVVRRKRRVEE